MEATEIRKLALLEDAHWWYRERRVLLRQMVERQFPGSAHGRVAIDVGAAGGGNTRVLRDLGFFAIPVEYELEGAVVARERGLAVACADARALPFENGSADLVVAFDVLEHIEEDHLALCEIRRILRPGGLLFVAVPADMRLWSDHDASVGHIRRYSAEQLAAVASDAGLRVTQIRSWNVLLRGVVAARRSRQVGSDLDELSGFVNLTLRGVITLERHIKWLGGRRGVSLLMQARHEDS